ncbi:sentrin-specific protease 6 [Gouania willdenowi]|uniref:sentrin-specific protease 6 n=1 Tax=Gouania willdenowi TaxID=441366 RepID=UPI001056B8DE|nr:sentrin-specific protease 6 [Gouania willdenowi]
MANNRSLFFDALNRSENRRDGGYKHKHSFALSDDSEDHRQAVVLSSQQKMEGQTLSSSEENKAPPLRTFPSSDPLRANENRPHTHMRVQNKQLSDPPLSVSSTSLLPTRTNVFILSPTPSQGIILQGRHFQHAQIAARKPVQRNDFSPQKVVELDSIVLTCPEIPEESLNIKRRTQQKKRPVGECGVFPSPAKAIEDASWPKVFQSVCVKCNKPSQHFGPCERCGSSDSLLSPTPRPPIRPIDAQQSFHMPATPNRTSRGVAYSVHVSDPQELLLAPKTSKGKRAGPPEHKDNAPIVLSSDDEDDSSSTGSVNRLDSVSPRPADSAHSSPAPSGGRVEAAVKSTAEKQEHEALDDFFKDVNMKISIPRRSRMKDQYGNQPPPETNAHRTKKPKMSADKCNSIILECRSVRVGTLRRMVTKPVVFSIDHIQLETQGEAPPAGCQMNIMEKVCLRASELISCEWCCVRKLPVIFFQTSIAESLRLRMQLNMSQEHGGEWYDCTGDQWDEKYIVLIFENGLVMNDQAILEDILEEIGRTNNLNNFPTKLTFEEANERLVNYNKASSQKEENGKAGQAPPTLLPVTPVQVGAGSPVTPVRTRMSTRQQSSSYLEDDDMTDLQPTFSGPVLKLMVYPPPPAKGGITVTNEDLHCLNDGEFLNDVIIDFYLKYLVLEKLKKEDAQRIHIFSSFFYKRLNQRERRNIPETTNLPIQKRKHNRVKTWTRHVDLFQKDFIFVPINESAHWYLAVVCFPGLDAPLLVGPPLPEDGLPDHCRPLSPDHDELESSSDQASPERTEAGEERAEPNGLQDAGSQSTSELQRISLCYSSDKGDEDDEHSYTQDEVSDGEDGNDESLMSESFLSSNKPTQCKQPCILIMDSLRGPTRSTVVKTLREYLEVEWEVRKGSRRSFGKEVMRGSSPRVPQQDNFSDCGVYVLQYVESFFQSPIPSFHLPLNLSDWFPTQRMKTKRDEIRELILSLQAQQEVGNTQQKVENIQQQGDTPTGSTIEEDPEIQEMSGS